MQQNSHSVACGHADNGMEGDMGFKNFGKGVRRAVVGLAAAFAVCASTPETPGTPTTPGESSNNGTTAPGPKEQAKKQTPQASVTTKPPVIAGFGVAVAALVAAGVTMRARGRNGRRK